MATEAGANKKRELFAWLAKDRHGNEGIIMIPTPSHGVVPLVSAEHAIALMAEAGARKAAALRGHTARLIRYEEAEVLMTLDVGGSGGN